MLGRVSGGSANGRHPGSERARDIAVTNGQWTIAQSGADTIAHPDAVIDD